MRIVRDAMSSPDNITASAASARDEIGRAIAAKIRETRSADELAKVTEEVLPQIEKFLESPEEKRLRRLRTGTIISSIGIGVAIALSIVSAFKNKEEFMFLAGLGLITFFIGLGFILNGVFLTVPKRSLQERNPNFEPDALPSAQQPQSFLEMPARAETNDLFPSVTEHTTKHLKNDR